MLTNAHNPEDVVVRLALEVDLGNVRDLLRTCVEDMQRRGLDQWDDAAQWRRSQIGGLNQ